MKTIVILLLSFALIFSFLLSLDSPLWLLVLAALVALPILAYYVRIGLALTKDRTAYYEARKAVWEKVSKEKGLLLKYDSATRESRLQGSFRGIEIDVHEKRTRRHVNAPLVTEISLKGPWSQAVKLHATFSRDVPTEPDLGDLSFARSFHYEGETQDLVMLFTEKVRKNLLASHSEIMLTMEDGRMLLRRLDQDYTFQPAGVLDLVIEVAEAFVQATQNPFESYLETARNDSSRSMKELAFITLRFSYGDRKECLELAEEFLRDAPLFLQIQAAALLERQDVLVFIATGFNPGGPESLSPFVLQDAEVPHDLKLEAINAFRMGDPEGLLGEAVDALLKSGKAIPSDMKGLLLQALKANPHPKNEASQERLLERS